MTDTPVPAVDQGIDANALGRLVGDLADAVVICDPDGIIVFWNGAAGRLFGWSAEQVVGTCLDVIIPERLRERHWHGYRQVMETGHTEYVDRLLEVPALHRDGRTISIAFTVSLLRRTQTGQIAGIAAVIRDETERWQERRRLLEEMARLRDDSAANPGRYPLA